MNLGLVTDSTADLPDELLAHYQIEVVPALLVIDGKEYRDQIDLPRQDFYARLPDLQKPPTTAAPSEEDFAQRYEKLLMDGARQVLSIHLASTLSGMFTIAQRAAQRFGGRVTVVDSGQLSLGLGFQVLAAAESAAAGLDAALAALHAVQPRIRVIALLDTLTYLRRSGRVSWARAMLGAALSLKPLVTVVQGGRVQRLGYVHTARQGETHLRELILGYQPLSRLAILHTNAPVRAQNLLQSLTLDLPQPPLLVNVTTIIGTHVGPNGLGFALVQQ